MWSELDAGTRCPAFRAARSNPACCAIATYATSAYLLAAPKVLMSVEAGCLAPGSNAPGSGLAMPSGIGAMAIVQLPQTMKKKERKERKGTQMSVMCTVNFFHFIALIALGIEEVWWEGLCEHA